MTLDYTTKEQKLNIVLERNTFFFRSETFEEKWEAHISSLTSLLLFLQHELAGKKSITDKKKVVVDILLKKHDGLSAVLALTSISEELLLRLITFAKTINDSDLNNLVKGKSFAEISSSTELNKIGLFDLVRNKRDAAESVANLLFEGFSVPILQKYLPLFELKKLNFSKLEFSPESLIDSIVRHAKRGAYKAQGDNDPAQLLKDLLGKYGIPYKSNVKPPGISRTLDLVIPSVTAPRIVVECSFQVTTSSAMGDKAKAEIEVASDIKKHHSQPEFAGFVDGIGWYVRKKDLAKLVSAFDVVFTFHPAELDRFLKYVHTVLQ
ncbi:MAG: hypothetical protein HY670_10945 [Chloroflexi bacterium]|nr:hypothetical protein [Chloroflexota bacterium]